MATRKRTPKVNGTNRRNANAMDAAKKWLMREPAFQALVENFAKEFAANIARNFIQPTDTVESIDELLGPEGHWLGYWNDVSDDMVVHHDAINNAAYRAAYNLVGRTWVEDERAQEPSTFCVK